MVSSQQAQLSPKIPERHVLYIVVAVFQRHLLVVAQVSEGASYPASVVFMHKPFGVDTVFPISQDIETHSVQVESSYISVYSPP